MKIIKILQNRTNHPENPIKSHNGDYDGGFRSNATATEFLLSLSYQASDGLSVNNPLRCGNISHSSISLASSQNPSQKTSSTPFELSYERCMIGLRSS